MQLCRTREIVSIMSFNFSQEETSWTSTKLSRASEVRSDTQVEGMLDCLGLKISWKVPVTPLAPKKRIWKYQTVPGLRMHFMLAILHPGMGTTAHSLIRRQLLGQNSESVLTLREVRHIDLGNPHSPDIKAGSSPTPSFWPARAFVVHRRRLWFFHGRY